jgi:hypothetical protein
MSQFSPQNLTAVSKRDKMPYHEKGHIRRIIGMEILSLKSYDLQFNSASLARTNLLNLKKDGKIYNLPLYAVSLLPGLVAGVG